MTTARRAILVLVGVALLAVFITRFLLVELFVRRVGIELVVAAIEAVAICGIGILALRVSAALLSIRGGANLTFSKARSGPRASAATAFILGYPIFGTFCFLIGTIRISTATMIVPMILGLAGVAIAVREQPGSWATSFARGNRADDSPDDSLPRAGQEDSRTSRFAFFAVALVLACGFVVAQAPPVSLDELAYHLAVPHTWSLEGRAIELPLLSHSYFPLGIESADLPLFTLLGSTAGTASHFLHLITALAVAWILTEFAVRKSGRSGALVAAAIVATPALAITTGWSLVEWPLLGIFLVAAIAAEEHDDAVLALALAAGLLTKYTFLPFAIALIAVTKRWRPAVAGAAAGSVFFLRNLLLAGNPVAPFFSAQAPHVSGFRAADIGAYIFDGRFVDESLGASMLMLVPAAAGAVAWLAVAIAVVLFALAASTRILLPYLAVGALSTLRRDGDAAAGMTLWRRSMHALLVAAIAVQLLLVVWFTWRGDAFALMAGRLSDDEYVAAQRASYPAIAWVNSRLPADSRTLVIGLNETYWFDHSVRGGGNFDGPRLSAYLADPNLRTKLQRDGITHVALFTQAAPTSEGRKREERETALSPEAVRSLTDLLSTGASPAGTFEGVRLFALR